jgi:hypothetical protein
MIISQIEGRKIPEYKVRVEQEMIIRESSGEALMRRPADGARRHSGIFK